MEDAQTSDAPPRELPAVLDAFGLGAARKVRLLGGTGTRKWDVATAGGRFVVRLRAAEFADLDATRFQHEVLRRLDRAGFPVPAPLLGKSAASWFVQDGNVYEVLSWIEGEPFVESDAAAVENLGVLLARMHRLFAGDPPPRNKTRLREDHPDLMRPYLAKLRPLARDARQRQRIGGVGPAVGRCRRETRRRAVCLVAAEPDPWRHSSRQPPFPPALAWPPCTISTTSTFRPGRAT